MIKQSEFSVQMQTTIKASLLLFLTLFGLSSCQFFQKSDEENNRAVLASVGEEVLYYDQVASMLKSISSEKDSLDKIQTISRNWVKNQLIMDKVKVYLPEEERLGVEKQVQDYRESLLISMYEEELVKQKLDTVVDLNTLKAFYKKNSSNFHLRKPAYQIYYIIVAKEAPKLDSLRWWAKNIATFRSQLSSYCYSFAEDFSLKDSIWIKNEVLLQKFPLENEIIERLARTKQTEELADSDYFYYLKINDSKDQGELAPLELIKNDIRKLILNKRKLNLIDQAYDQIYQEGIKKGKFEIY